MSLSLVLLNDTLRLHDNPLLQLPAETKAALVVLDYHPFFGTQYGLARANLSRLQQQLVVITYLKQQLAAHNIGLITLVGDRVQLISELARVAKFIWQGRHILTYQETRNQLLGQHYASFCSTPLTLGSLSVR